MKEWHKIDLHIHAEHGITFDGKKTDNNPNFYSLKNMLKRNEINDLSLVALTEHNMLNVMNNLKLSYALSHYGKTQSLPGVEVDLVIKSTRYHVIVVFSKRVNILQVAYKIKTKVENKKKTRYLDLDEFLDVIQNTECIIIPHACKKSGLKPELGDSISPEVATGLIDVLRSGNFVNFLFEHTKQFYKGSFAKSVLENASSNWISVEELEQTRVSMSAGITGSDYRFRTPEPTTSEKDFTAIWADPTFRGLELVCLFPENRILMFDQIIEKNNYISQIHIHGNKYFSESKILLSSGLNSIIGSSASGKTALLHIIAKKIGGKSIREKTYSFTDDLLVDFLDKDGNPINFGDIKVEVAESLYEKITRIHDSDIKGILELFNYSINQKSNEINVYDNLINNYSSLETQYLNTNENLNLNIQRFNENSKNYIVNTKGKQNGISRYSIVNSSSGKISASIDEILSITKAFKEISVLVENMRLKFDETRFMLDKFAIKSELGSYITLMEKELQSNKRMLNLRYLNLKRELTIQRRINDIITEFNSRIGQKSEYIQRLNNNIQSSKDSIISLIRSSLVLEKRKNYINLDFPTDRLMMELSNANRNEYIDLQIRIDESIFVVGPKSGILEYEKNATVLKSFKDMSVSNSNDLKKMISGIIAKGGLPRFRKSEIVDEIIKSSNLKLGYPKQDKISIEDVSPGDASKIYIDYKFKTDFKNGNFNIVLFDQPENDVDKEFIYQELLRQISDLKHESQVILTSHDPLIVINGDSNRIIKTTKLGKKILYSSYSLENYECDKPITSIVSRFVDGDELAVKKRYELYTGGNAKW